MLSATARGIARFTPDERGSGVCVCVYYILTKRQKGHETRARKPKGQLNSKEQPASKSEFPPGLNVLYQRGVGSDGVV